MFILLMRCIDESRNAIDQQSDGGYTITMVRMGVVPACDCKHEGEVNNVHTKMQNHRCVTRGPLGDFGRAQKTESRKKIFGGQIAVLVMRSVLRRHKP